MGILSRRIPTTRLMAQMAAFIRNPCLLPMRQTIIRPLLSTHRRAVLYFRSLVAFLLAPFSLVVFRDQVLISSVIFIPPFSLFCVPVLLFLLLMRILSYAYLPQVLFSPFFFFVSLIVIDSKPVDGSLLLISSHTLCLVFHFRIDALRTIPLLVDHIPFRPCGCILSIALFSSVCPMCPVCMVPSRVKLSNPCSSIQQFRPFVSIWVFFFHARTKS